MSVNPEVFRFTVTRQPKRVPEDDSRINPVFLPDATSPFLATLMRLRSNGLRDEMIEEVSRFARSEEFVDRRERVDRKYAELAFVIADNLQKPNDSYFQENFERIFSPDDANTIVNSDDYNRLYERVENSIIACASLPNIPNTVKSLNVFVVYALHLIKQLAVNSLNSKKIRDSVIIIPKGIFPLPPVKSDLNERYKRELEQRKKSFERHRRKIEETSKLLVDNNEAITEVINTFEKMDDYEGRRNSGFMISRKISNRLSDKTKQILRNYGLSSNEVDVSKSVAILEKSSSAAVKKISKNVTPGTRMIKIGSVLLPVDYLDSRSVPGGDYGTLVRALGVCPPTPVVGNEPDGDVTSPVSHGQAYAYGFSDLMVVEQNLSHYELGEIAHIENVLKSEIRTRQLNITKTREETQLTETEETSEKTEDLSTTERFELGKESQSVINENSSMDVGVTVTASYGPSVDVTGSFNYSTSTSTQDSTSTSSNFSRDTTTRAINRIEKRKLARRIVRTLEEVEERNRHVFKNDAADASDISGIYRWVDKIYELQVVNYGKRFMLEFIVPEPAAFFRYAMSKLPDEVNTLVKPDPPGWCEGDGKTFHPLEMTDIQREDYYIWIGKYNVQDVSPPPPEFITASQSKSLKPTEVMKFENKTHRFSINEGLVDIPDGYIPKAASVNLSWAGGGQEGSNMWVQVQSEQVDAAQMEDKGVATITFPSSALTPSVPFTIDSNHIYTYAAIINIACTLSNDKLTEWQLKTYNAIMNAYYAQKSRYDDAVKTVTIRTGFSQIKGKNPLFNRETEKLELKKGCISILTAQRYDTFDAVKKNVAPYGYPEIVNFDEARADSEYIRRFEQAFEWNNMTYLFYPYFWGNKEDWVMVSKLDDEDPLFARFLQAGAARVLVPVRPGFEKTIIDYLEIEQEWNAEGTVMTEGDETDPFNISIVDEIKNQTGNNNIDGKGTLKVNKGSTTITGKDTEFSSNDENRRIVIKAKTYIIKKVLNENKIVLTSKYGEEDDDEAIYSLGGILVGQPWKVKLPTSLVKLDSNITIV